MDRNIRIPSPKKKKEWDIFWVKYQKERRLLENFFYYGSKNPVSLEILNMNLADLSNNFKVDNKRRK